MQVPQVTLRCARRRGVGYKGRVSPTAGFEALEKTLKGAISGRDGSQRGGKDTDIRYIDNKQISSSQAVYVFFLKGFPVRRQDELPNKLS